MHELCFSTSLSSSEWAAWMQAAAGWAQAVGAVAAVFVAIGVSRMDLNRRLAESERSEKGFDRVVDAFRFQGLNAAELMNAAMKKRDMPALQKALYDLDGAVSIGDEIDIGRFEMSVIFPFVRIKSAMKNMIACANQMAGFTGPQYVAALNSFEPKIEQCYSAIKIEYDALDERLRELSVMR